MEEGLETGRRKGRREKTSGVDDLGCVSSLRDGMVPSQAEEKNLLSLSVSEIMLIFEWGIVHLRWQDHICYLSCFSCLGVNCQSCWGVSFSDDSQGSVSTSRIWCMCLGLPLVVMCSNYNCLGLILPAGITTSAEVMGLSLMAMSLIWFTLLQLASML